MSGRIPATVVTGFLGAGKTSLIRHLLRTANGRRLALVINEFGDVGIDGELLKGCGAADGCTEDDIVELANGCICCTVADDFLPTIQALLARPARPDHIVIETSGLALPKPLVRAFNWPEVRTRVTVDGVVTVVDGPAVAAGLFAADMQALERQRAADPSLDHESPIEELFEDQIACADLVLVNKADLLEDDACDRIVAEIESRVRPGVRVLATRHAAIDADILLGLEAAAEADLSTRPSHHDEEDDHDHDEFESFVLELGEVESPERLAGRIRAAVATHPILRIKGFAAVAGKDMRLVVQVVGDRLQYYYDRDWQPGEQRQTRLVVIGLAGLGRDAVARAVGG